MNKLIKGHKILLKITCVIITYKNYRPNIKFLKGEKEMKKILSVLIIAMLVVGLMCTTVFAANEDLPKANLEKLPSRVLEGGSYMIWPSGDDSIDRPLNVVVKFSSIDTEETVAQSPYKGWYTDFYITFDGLANGNFDPTGCYLAGNYGSFGWVVIPVEKLLTNVEEDEVYPVVSVFDPQLTYEEICTDVKEMICAIYIKDEIIAENPDMEITLNLGIKDGEDGEVVYVNSSVYNADVLAGKAADYDSLVNAVAVANNGDTVKIARDIEMTGTVTIPKGKTITIDLNGHKLSGVDNQAAGKNFNLITNKGTLTIKDSVGGGFVELTANVNKGWSNSSTVVSNEGGIFTLESGKLIHKGGSDMAYGVDNNSTVGATTAYIKGGEISTPYRGIRLFQNSKTEVNTVNVSGGKISARCCIWAHQPGNSYSEGVVNITGGIFDAVANGVCIDMFGPQKTTVNISGGTFSNTSQTANLLLVWPFDNMAKVSETNETLINVTGGTFNCTGEGKTVGTLDENNNTLANGTDIVKISGGTFNQNSVGYLENGLMLFENADGKYDVVEYEPVKVQVNGGQYEDGTAAVVFNTLFSEYEESEEVTYGLFVYVSGRETGKNIKLAKENITEEGWISVLVDEIPEDAQDEIIICVPFEVRDGQVTQKAASTIKASDLGKKITK